MNAYAVLSYPAKLGNRKKLKEALSGLCQAYEGNEGGYTICTESGIRVHRWTCMLPSRFTAERFLHDAYLIFAEHIGEGISIDGQEWSQLGCFHSYAIEVDEAKKDIVNDSGEKAEEWKKRTDEWMAQAIASLIWSRYQAQGGILEPHEFMKECMTQGGVSKVFVEEGLHDLTTPTEPR